MAKKKSASPKKGKMVKWREKMESNSSNGHMRSLPASTFEDPEKTDGFNVALHLLEKA